MVYAKAGGKDKDHQDANGQTHGTNCKTLPVKNDDIKNKAKVISVSKYINKKKGASIECTYPVEGARHEAEMKIAEKRKGKRPKSR